MKTKIVIITSTYLHPFVEKLLKNLKKNVMSQSQIIQILNTSQISIKNTKPLLTVLWSVVQQLCLQSNIM